jgi:hypothetical protein
MTITITRVGRHRLLRPDGTEISQHTDTDEAIERASALPAGTYTLVTADKRIAVTASVVEPPVTPPVVPPVTPPAGTTVLFTDLVSAPANALVTQYLSDGSKRTVSPQEAGIRIHEGRVIEVTPATIKAALATWQAGDVFYLRGGEYVGVLKSDSWNFSSNFDIIRSPATPERPIAIIGYPGEVARLSGAGSRPNFIFANSGGGLKASNMVVANLSLEAANTCIDSGANIAAENTGGENLRIVGNTLKITATGNTMTGMVNFGGNGSVALGNAFIDNPDRQIINNNHALYVHAGCDGVEVGWNTFKHLRMGHVVQVHQDGVARDYLNIYIHDNLLEGKTPDDMRGITVSNVSSSSTVKIERNTLRNLGQNFSGVAVYAGIVEVLDNKFYNIKAPNILTDGEPMGSSGRQTRKITAKRNRFDASAGSFILTARGASMDEIALEGNMYCGGAPLAQDASPRPCQ